MQTTAHRLDDVICSQPLSVDKCNARKRESMLLLIS